MQYVTRIRQKAKDLSTLMVRLNEEKSWKLTAPACVVIILLFAAVLALDITSDRAAIQKIQEQCQVAKQRLDQLPSDSIEAKMANRSLALTGKRLIKAGQGQDSLVRQLLATSQYWLAKAQRNELLDSTGVPPEQNWDQELNLLQEVQLQIAALPQDMPETRTANRFLLQAEERLIALPHPAGYADKQVQQWFGDSQLWVKEAQKKRSQAPPDSL